MLCCNVQLGHENRKNVLPCVFLWNDVKLDVLMLEVLAILLDTKDVIWMLDASK